MICPNWLKRLGKIHLTKLSRKLIFYRLPLASIGTVKDIVGNCDDLVLI